MTLFLSRADLESAMRGLAHQVRSDTIEACATVAENRALKLRSKAKTVTSPRQQSYFAQSMEARVIAEHLRNLAKAERLISLERKA